MYSISFSHYFTLTHDAQIERNMFYIFRFLNMQSSNEFILTLILRTTFSGVVHFGSFHSRALAIDEGSTHIQIFKKTNTIYINR